MDRTSSAARARRLAGRWLLGLAAACLAVAGTGVARADQFLDVSGKGVCVDHTWQVTWSITNVSAVSLTITGTTVKSNNGTFSATGYATDPIPAGGSTSASSALPGDVGPVVLTLDYVGQFGSGFVNVELAQPAQCTTVESSSTTTSTTTTTTAPPTTEAPTTTLAATTSSAAPTTTAATTVAATTTSVASEAPTTTAAVTGASLPRTGGAADALLAAFGLAVVTIGLVLVVEARRARH